MLPAHKGWALDRQPWTLSPPSICICIIVEPWKCWHLIPPMCNLGEYVTMYYKDPGWLIFLRWFPTIDSLLWNWRELLQITLHRLCNYVTLKLNCLNVKFGEGAKSWKYVESVRTCHRSFAWVASLQKLLGNFIKSQSAIIKTKTATRE